MVASTFFSENRHPFVCFADISPNRGVTFQERLTDAFRKFVQAAGLRWKAIPPSLRDTSLYSREAYLSVKIASDFATSPFRRG